MSHRHNVDYNKKTEKEVLFIMNRGLAKNSTSEHIMGAILAQLATTCKSVHILQMTRKNESVTTPSKVDSGKLTVDTVCINPHDKGKLIIRYFAAIKNYFGYIRYLKKYRHCDSVFLQSTNVAGFIVWLVKRYVKNARIIYNVQDVFPYNLAYCGRIRMGGVVFNALAKIQRYGYQHADTIITISEDMKETLVKDGVDPGKIVVIYNWSYQDNIYNEIDLSPVLHLFNNNKFNVVYAGNVGLMQNVDIMIDVASCFRENKGIMFHIIGNGVNVERLKKKVADEGLYNVSFWPLQPPELAPLIYCAADINFVPLKENIYRTALPSKTATVFACQKPVIMAIGKNSIFAQKATLHGCIVTESNAVYEIVRAIKSIKNGNTATVDEDYFRSSFSITLNSKKYADIITSSL